MIDPDDFVNWREEANRLRARVLELEGVISKTIDAINSQSPKPRMSIHARAMLNILRNTLTP